jgi:sigma-B regulation protein RsbU (phosphoserine phosphatase)
MIHKSHQEEEFQLQKIFADLELKELQLKVLLDITQSINRNVKIDELLSIYENFLKNELKVGKLALFTYDSHAEDLSILWKCSLFYGANPSLKTIDVFDLLQDIKHPQSISSAHKTLNDFTYVIPVFHKDTPLAYLLIGNIRHAELDYNDDILPFVQLITNIILVANENKRFAKEQIKQAELKKEMSVAQKMQMMLFPELFAEHQSIEIYGTYIPHHRIGGDYYDYFSINEHEHIICIADVSGKGVSAALLMSNFQANLHALIKHFTTLEALITDLNTCVIKSAHGEKHITFFVALANTQTYVLTYINAGHPPPILTNEKGIHLLKTGTTGLGMFEELPFLSMGYTKITQNCKLLCYTDGVIEIENSKGLQFGIEGLEKFMVDTAHIKSLPELHSLLIETLKTFNSSKTFLDDISLLSCRCKS